MQAGLVVVDKDAGGDVHRVAEDEAFFDAAFFYGLGDLAGDVDKLPSGFRVEHKLFSVTFHILPFLLLDIQAYAVAVPVRR